MILSDRVLCERLILDQAELVQAKIWWEERDWTRILDRILIEPFSQKCLGPCDYQLSIGEEYVILQDLYNTRQLKKNEQILLGPGDTALILTEEYIALPRNVIGFVVPRARRLFEGSSISATRIDPTWYGKLLIGFTNLAKFPVVLRRGDPFCVIYFAESAEVEKAISWDAVKHLGRIKIDKIDFSDLRPKDLLRPEDVTETKVREVIESFGRPYDIVFGAMEQNRTIIYEAMERELGPKLAEVAANHAVQVAFREQQKLLRNLVIGILALIGVPIVTWVVTWILKLLGVIQ